MEKIELLNWDSDFFGFNVAKITDELISPENFSDIYQELKKKKIKLAYWQTETDYEQQSLISAQYKGYLADIKTTYLNTKLNRNLDSQTGKIEFFKNKPDKNILEIAVECGEFSRFKIDPDFPNQKFKDLYKTWLIKSITGELADKVIITKKDNSVTGLITVECENEIGSIGLVGVHHEYRGQGFGGKLIKAALQYFVNRNCHSVNVVTQGKNLAACRLYEKFGFTIRSKKNFYHFWL